MLTLGAEGLVIHKSNLFSCEVSILTLFHKFAAP